MQDANVPKPAARHVEGSQIPTDTAKIHNGDAALALFDNLEDMHEGFEEGEEPSEHQHGMGGWQRLAITGNSLM